MDKFALSAAFVKTSLPLASLKLCEVRLQADVRWPWIVLIPRKAGVREVEHLPAPLRALLMEEITAAGVAVRAVGSALGRPVEKLNIGLLGNVTPQLHAHVVGRRQDDPAWPGPVWGVGEAQAYAAHDLDLAIQAAQNALDLFTAPRETRRG